MPHEIPAIHERSDPLDELLPRWERVAHPPGSLVMLRLIAYDIANPKRLRRVCAICKDYGVRIQKSLFECWLEDADFESLWTKLEAVIEPSRDGLLACTLDAADAGRRRAAGVATQLTSRPGCQLF